MGVSVVNEPFSNWSGMNAPPGRRVRRSRDLAQWTWLRGKEASNREGGRGITSGVEANNGAGKRRLHALNQLYCLPM